MQVSETYWAYSSIGPLSNVIYKRVQLIYTGTTDSQSNSTIDSMYIAQFADPDVGQSSDDYAGCKPAINLGFAYNSSPNDAFYSVQGYAPPAIGYVFLQGAAYKTGDPNDSAIVYFKTRGGNANHEVKGYKYFSNTPMSGFVYFAAGGIWSDPPAVGNSAFNYTNSTLGMYNLMRGYQENAANNFHYPMPVPFPRPAQFGGQLGGVGTYLLDGDPVTGSGWIDGLVEGAGDRRILCINGPISMKLNDTVEVVLALVGGMGSNNISSVSTLEYNTQFAQYLYSNLFSPILTSVPRGDTVPSEFKLEQNYPNPFNPTTTINFSVPKTSLVTLKVYDILGREVVKLVNNEEKTTGNYKINFNANMLSSGVYMYRLQAGTFVESKKMLLLK